MTESADLARARAMLDLGRHQQAAALLAGVVATRPQDALAWTLLARAHLGMGDHTHAVAAAGRATGLDPAAEWPHRIISTALTHLRDHDGALLAAERARRLAPGLWQVHVCIAQAALGGARLDLAAQAASAARAIAPDEADVHYMAGKVCLASGELAAARECQARALALRPVHPGALNELGRIDLKRNNPRGAIRQFIAAARAAPQEAVYGRNAQVGIFHLLARTCYVLGIACVLMAVAVVDGHLHGAGLTLMLGALGGVIAACAGWVAVRTPPEARRLLVRTLRQPRMAGALAVALGGIVVAVTVISTGSASMPSNVVVVVFTIAGTRIAATVVLRRRKRSR